MADTGFVSAGTVVNDATAGTVGWGTPGNATASDDAHAFATVDTIEITSQYLKATNFGFSIPEGNNVFGVELRVEKHATDIGGCPAASNFQDWRIFLVIGGIIQSSKDNKATVDEWPGSDAEVDYGGASDVWGQQNGRILRSAANSSNFGVVISGQETQSDSDAFVDHIQLKLTYSDTFLDEYIPGLVDHGGMGVGAKPSGSRDDDEYIPTPYFRELFLPEKKIIIPAF